MLRGASHTAPNAGLGSVEWVNLTKIYKKMGIESRAFWALEIIVLRFTLLMRSNKLGGEPFLARLLLGTLFYYPLFPPKTVKFFLVGRHHLTVSQDDEILIIPLFRGV